jgi:hypothetical protein
MTLAPQKNITKIISSVYNTYLLTNESIVYGIGYGAVFDYFFKFLERKFGNWVNGIAINIQVH